MTDAKNIRILLDMDEVVAQCMKHWLERIYILHGEDVARDDIDRWEFHEHFKHTDKDDIYNILREPGFFAALEPIDGAIDGVKKLVDAGFDVVFVTSCAHGHSDKRAWLKKHMPFFDRKNIIFAERKELVTGDIFVDDRPQNLYRWVRLNNKNAICFTAPHNSNNKLEYRWGLGYWTCHRVDNWDELLAKITELTGGALDV